MDCLATDPERVSDGLPIPTLGAGIGNVDRLQTLLESLQRPHRAQALCRVRTVSCIGQHA